MMNFTNHTYLQQIQKRQLWRKDLYKAFKCSILGDVHSNS